MKSMLKHLGITALLIGALAVAKAQDGQMPSAEARAAKMTDWMKTNLNLTADQLGKVQALNLKYAQKMDSARNNTGDRQAKFAQMKSDNEARDTELKGILTDDQYKTYQEKKQEMKSKYKSKSMGQGGQ